VYVSVERQVIVAASEDVRKVKAKVKVKVTDIEYSGSHLPTGRFPNIDVVRHKYISPSLSCFAVSCREGFSTVYNLYCSALLRPTSLSRCGF